MSACPDWAGPTPVSQSRSFFCWQGIQWDPGPGRVEKRSAKPDWVLWRDLSDASLPAVFCLARGSGSALPGVRAVIWVMPGTRVIARSAGQYSQYCAAKPTLIDQNTKRWLTPVLSNSQFYSPVSDCLDVACMWLLTTPSDLDTPDYGRSERFWLFEIHLTDCFYIPHRQNMSIILSICKNEGSKAEIEHKNCAGQNSELTNFMNHLHKPTLP